jgi:EAL and modified HD-GYP domain-containing signal transduction protein
LDIFLARQPILDRNRNLFGYELLYRSSLENRFDVSVTRDHAAASVIGNSTFVMGLEELTGNHLAFLNVSRRVLESDTLSLLPHDRVVIELLEDIPPEPSVIEACRGLKERGFRLALDDYVFDDDRESLLDLVDIVKLDWLELAEHERAIIVHEMRERGIIALAEKVESWTDFADGVQMGCSYFQGFFFAQPEMIHQNDTAAAKANCLRLLREVHRGDLQVTRIEEVAPRSRRFPTRSSFSASADFDSGRPWPPWPTSASTGRANSSSRPPFAGICASRSPNVSS